MIAFIELHSRPTPLKRQNELKNRYFPQKSKTLLGCHSYDLMTSEPGSVQVSCNAFSYGLIINGERYYLNTHFKMQHMFKKGIIFCANDKVWLNNSYIKCHLERVRKAAQTHKCSHDPNNWQQKWTESTIKNQKMKWCERSTGNSNWPKCKR